MKINIIIKKWKINKKKTQKIVKEYFKNLKKKN